MQSFTKKLALYFLGFVIVIFAVVYLSTPYIARHFAKAPLSDFGIHLTPDSYVTYNLLTSTLIVEDLVVLDSENKPAATIDELSVSAHLYKLAFKRIHISELALDGGLLTVVKNGDELIVAGVNLSELPETDSDDIEAEPAPGEKSDYLFTLSELRIANVVVEAHIDGQDHRFTLNHFAIDDLWADANAQSLKMELSSQLNEATIDINSDLNLNAMQGDLELDLDIQGLSLNNYQHLVPDEDVSLAGKLSVKGEPTIELTDTLIKVELDKLTIHLDELVAGYTPWIYSATSHAVTLSDVNVETSTTSSHVVVSSEVDMLFADGQVAVDSNDNVLASWGELSLTPVIEVTENKQHLVVEKFQVEDIHFSKSLALMDTPPVARLSHFTVNQIHFLGDRVEIDSIALGQGNATIHVNPDKTIDNMVDLTALQSSEPVGEEVAQNPETISPEPSEATDETPTFSFSLGELVLESPFEIAIHDESVSPVYNHHLSLSEVHIGALDSAKPSMKTPVAVHVNDDEYFSLDVKGDASPFGEKIDAALIGSLRELTLTEISPYMKDALGFEMKTGQLDVDLDLGIEQDELSGSTLLNMRGLEMTKSDDYEQGAIKEGQAMPLNVALGMLKDDQGNITLDVPMSGNLADPSFGVSSFMTLILKKAAMSQAKSYLMQTFVPYANVVSIVMSGAEYLLKLRLEPLLFAPQQIAFNDEQRVYLDQLTLLMTDKPEVQIKTCAVSTVADLNLANDAELTTEQSHSLVEMGQRRQELLKTYLVEQGVPSSRVLSCAPEIDRGDEALPRIELKTD